MFTAIQAIRSTMKWFAVAILWVVQGALLADDLNLQIIKRSNSVMVQWNNTPKPFYLEYVNSLVEPHPHSPPPWFPTLDPTTNGDLLQFVVPTDWSVG